MGMMAPLFSLVKQVSKKGDKLLAFGYPDALITPQELVRLVGNKQPKYREDSEEIAGWHSFKGRIPETKSLFKLIGVEMTAIDIHPSRDCERIVDLNGELPNSFYHKFNIVLDAGTCEHCFNIGSAFKCAMDAVKVGGYVIHENPLTMPNHGFYSVQPTAYYDFYTQNGFEPLLIQGATRDSSFNVPAYQRFNGAPENATTVAVFRRKTKQPFKWPTQSKYLGNPELKKSA